MSAPDEIVIGRLEPADHAAWETLFRGYIDFYERHLDQAEYDRTWSRLLEDSEIHGQGARLDGELVGITHFMTHPHTNANDVCYLQDLFTAPEARGRGIGRALIAYVTEWAREHDCSRVYWLTQDSNAQARVLYDKVADNSGFIVYRIDL